MHLLIPPSIHGHGYIHDYMQGQYEDMIIWLGCLYHCAYHDTFTLNLPFTLSSPSSTSWVAYDIVCHVGTSGTLGSESRESREYSESPSAYHAA